jgi:hypothetical protein
VKLSARALIAPLLAALAMAVVITQTVAALRDSGAWEARPARRVGAPVESPYARLDREIGRISQTPVADNLRNPFAWGTSATARVAGPVRRRVVKPVPPPVPVLTAIVWDNDPRALIHWGDRDFTVRRGDLFAEFRVTSITRDLVVLDHSGESLTLRRPINKGE